MFVDLIIITLVVSLVMIQYMMSLVSFTIPIEIQLALTQLFSYLNYLADYVPLYPDATVTGFHQSLGIMTIFSWSLTIYITIQVFKIALWGLKLIPFLHIKTDGAIR